MIVLRPLNSFLPLAAPGLAGFGPFFVLRFLLRMRLWFRTVPVAPRFDGRMLPATQANASRLNTCEWG